MANVAPMTGIDMPDVKSHDVVAKDVLDAKDYTFPCPTFDPDLKNLIAYYQGDARALFLDWLEGCWKIDKAAVIRRRIDAVNGNGKVAKPRKRPDYLTKLNLAGA